VNLIIALLVSLGFAALLLLQWRKAEISRRAEEARAELISELSKRFGDSDEFVAFARSSEGRLLLGTRDGTAELARKLLLMAQGGVLLAALGAAFLITVATTPANADINLIRAAEEAQYWGTFCLALSVGLGTAFWFGQRRAQAWGLLPR